MDKEAGIAETVEIEIQDLLTGRVRVNLRVEKSGC